MHISWLGSTTIKIQTKPLTSVDDVTVLIDPYKPQTGSFPRSLAPDIVLLTRGKEEAITLSGHPYLLSSPGEIETKGVLVTAVAGHDPLHVMFRIDSEQMSLAHIGSAKEPLTDEQLEILSDVDILCLPVGGDDCFDAEQAVKAVNAIEPKVVIPMKFHSDNNPQATGVESFLRAMGVANGEVEKKVILKQKDLPQEETRVIVLGKE